MNRGAWRAKQSSGCKESDTTKQLNTHMQAKERT